MTIVRCGVCSSAYLSAGEAVPAEELCLPTPVRHCEEVARRMQRVASAFVAATRYGGRSTNCQMMAQKLAKNT
eukprot:CAMPEP_0115587718 /NCGR_PEP_ID=MMETSP0272-20121206/8349_1 /TAXON_ID=71861 /ORGANISM="Scrippsiella trochoidea, Strain CCMP3099" /LENGTH=72 /DNA_ID=CAMNT_0003022803 /DNA_START=38 /DNA_END=252 /DNA_ORIENTATION=-